MPSYLISLLEVKLIKLPTYESAAELDLELSVAMLISHTNTTDQFKYVCVSIGGVREHYTCVYI